jgi:hypothetical protein
LYGHFDCKPAPHDEHVLQTYTGPIQDFMRSKGVSFRSGKLHPPSRRILPFHQYKLSRRQYAIASQIHLHGYDLKEAIIELSPRPGEFTLKPDDILNFIAKEGSSISLVLFSGIQYYTGQLFPMESITRAAKEKVNVHTLINTAPFIERVTSIRVAYAAGIWPMLLEMCPLPYMTGMSISPSGVLTNISIPVREALEDFSYMKNGTIR